jgi:capsid protein
MIQHVAEPIFREWLTIGMAKGVIPFPDNRYDKFASAAHFKGRGFSPIDPQKEIKAFVEGMQNGIYSPSDIQANFGRDSEAVFSQIQADLKLAEKFGLDLNLLPLGPKLPAQPETDSDDL